jgi:hypothetical protein
MRRIHVAIRLVLLVALGTAGWSSLYWLFYLALPAVAALLLNAHGADRYAAQDVPRAERVLRWFARAYAYLWLLTDEVPSVDGPAPPIVELRVEPTGRPTPSWALLRLLTSLPALLLLGLLSCVAVVLWLIGAIAILAVQRVPPFVHDFIAMKLRYQFRLLAYHLSLVDRYPSLEEAPISQVPRPRPA